MRVSSQLQSAKNFARKQIAFESNVFIGFVASLLTAAPSLLCNNGCELMTMRPSDRVTTCKFELACVAQVARLILFPKDFVLWVNYTEIDQKINIKGDLNAG